jgi:hypothetical protein
VRDAGLSGDRADGDAVEAVAGDDLYERVAQGVTARAPRSALRCGWDSRRRGHPAGG